jgi:REP element-mobilizing transposase RayT
MDTIYCKGEMNIVENNGKQGFTTVPKKMRLNKYDYSKKGYYYVTICTKNRKRILWCKDVVFNDINNNDWKIPLSDIGRVVESAISNIPQYYSHVTVEQYVVMPNHVHIILCINESNHGKKYAPLSIIMNQMKGFITKQIGFSIWQRSYNDRVIRYESEYIKIAKYIIENPVTWESDIHNI